MGMTAGRARPGFRQDWMVGLQAYAYDVNEEGAAAVVEGARRVAANVIFVGLSYSDTITTRDPERAPRLVRNRLRERHAEEAYVAPGSDLYPTALTPPVAADPALDGAKAFEDLREAASGHGIAVVPWILGLSQRVAMLAPERAVVNARGDTVPGWLCPNQVGVAEFLAALVDDLVTRFGPPAVFLDGTRFPEPRPGRIADGAGCFCDRCVYAASAAGLSLEPARTTLLRMLDSLEADPATAARIFTREASSAFRTWRSASRNVALLDWLEFRQRSIERMVRIAEAVARGRSEIWLDVWPPTYGWLLGQDLERLARYSPWTRPFTYHRWGGGADLPGLFGSLSQEPSVQQALYHAFLQFFGFPGPPSFGEFRERGLDPAFITQETEFLAHLLGDRSHPVAGIQIWQVGEAGVHEALQAAANARPRGIILHCYGWATDAEMHAAGSWLRSRGLEGRPAEASR
jgi:hypothetical protein